VVAAQAVVEEGQRPARGGGDEPGRGLGQIDGEGELFRTSGVSPTTISLCLRGKRELRPAPAVRLVEGLERAFVRKGLRSDAAFFSTDCGQ